MKKMKKPLNVHCWNGDVTGFRISANECHEINIEIFDESDEWGGGSGVPLVTALLSKKEAAELVKALMTFMTGV